MLNPTAVYEASKPNSEGVIDNLGAGGGGGVTGVPRRRKTLRKRK